MLPFTDRVLKVCDRKKDHCTEELRKRAMACNNFVAAEDAYQYNCNKRFSVASSKEPKQSTSSGRPVIEDCNDAFNKSRNESLEDEVKHIIQTAAKIALDDIKSINYQYEEYPDKDISDIEKGSERLPSYLRLLITCIIKSPTKAVSIGQNYCPGHPPKVLYYTKKSAE